MSMELPLKPEVGDTPYYSWIGWKFRLPLKIFFDTVRGEFITGH